MLMVGYGLGMVGWMAGFGFGFIDVAVWLGFEIPLQQLGPTSNHICLQYLVCAYVWVWFGHGWLDGWIWVGVHRGCGQLGF